VRRAITPSDVAASFSYYVHATRDLFRSYSRQHPASAELAGSGLARLSDLAREVRIFTIRQLECAEEFVQETALIRTFTNRPLTSVMPLVVVGTAMGTIFVCNYVVLAVISVPSLVFHSSFSLALCSYVQAVVTDPGRIPEDWASPSADEPAPSLAQRNPKERKKTTDEYRFCKKELKFKPDRAHYCAPMGRNVLRMDHYCPWLGNCVGHFNHRYFLLFLLYTVLSVNCSNVGLVRALWSHANSSTAGTTFMMLQGTLLNTLISSVLTPFLVFHCWLLKNNMTTIEFCEKRGEGEGYKSPYDVGVVKNIRSVFGDDVLWWFVPITVQVGNGMDFERTPALDEDDAATGNPTARTGATEGISIAASSPTRPNEKSGKKCVRSFGVGQLTDVASHCKLGISLASTRECMSKAPLTSAVAELTEDFFSFCSQPVSIVQEKIKLARSNGAPTITTTIQAQRGLA